MVKVTTADDAAQGALQYLAIGTSAGSLTDVSVYSSGLSTASLERSGQSRTIPGGGLRKASQPLGRVSNTFNFEVDKNDLTRPILQNLGGDKLYVEWGPFGNATGKPKYTLNGPCPLQRPSPANDVARYIAALAVDSLVRGTF